RFTFDSTANILASAEVSLINAPVGPHPICMRPSTEILTSVQLPAASAAKKFSGFTVIRTNRKSAYAIVNPSTNQTATVFLSLMDFAGKLVAGGTTSRRKIASAVSLTSFCQTLRRISWAHCESQAPCQSDLVA